MSDAQMDKVTGGGPDQTVVLPGQSNGFFKNLNGDFHSGGRAADHFCCK
jgi:hypothetical protein